MAQEGAPNHLRNVKHIILILSGKGGVGKSTVASQVAIALQKMGKKVGLLDIDLCGPSIPRMFGVETHDVHQCPDGWVPVYVNNEQTLGIMSIGFLLTNKSDPVIWRGPKKNAMIRQFLSDVYWQGLDYLVIDTPPGTSDEHISVVEAIREYNPDGAVLVTTPQAVAVGDVRRELTFCRKTGIPVLGVVENMSGFACPNCQECTNVFSKGGGQALAEFAQVPFLGCLPLDPNLTRCLESGLRFLDMFEQSPVAHQVTAIVQRLVEQCSSTE